MAELEKIVKLTKEQYNKLANNEQVGEYKGLNDNYLYLVQSEENYVDLTSDQEIQGIKTFKDGITLEMAPNIFLGQDYFGNELICVSEQGNVLTSENQLFIGVENEQLTIHRLVEPEHDSDAATKGYVDSQIPTVNNGTLTIQKNGTNVATFTANQSGNSTANITVPTKTSDLTNDTGYITGVSWGQVTDKPTLLTLDDIGADNIHMNHGDSTAPTIATRISDLSFGKQDKITSTNKLPATNISGLATVATSGSYTDLSNKPTIPTVNNATLTIQKNGTTVKTFTANASSNVTANITVPTKVTDLSDNADYVKYNSVLMPTNPFGGKGVYINSMDNALFAADKKFYVTVTRHKKVVSGITYPYADATKAITDDDHFVDSPSLSTEYANVLFDGSYEGGLTCASDEYMKVRIMFGPNTSPSSTTSYQPGYPYGTFYLSYYYDKIPSERSHYRVYNKYTSHTPGWKKFNTSIFCSTGPTIMIEAITDDANYQRTCIEFIIFGGPNGTSLTEIDWKLTRPDLASSGATVTKFGPQSVYSTFGWYNNHIKVAAIEENGNAIFKNVYPINNEGKASGTYGSIGNTTAQWENAFVKYIYEDGTLLSNKYAAKTHIHSYNDLTNKPTLLTLDDIGADNIHMNHGDSTSPTIESRISGLSFGKQDKITSTNKLPASNISGLATVATSGSYNDLSNKPTIPTKTSQLTNDSGFITGVAWVDVTDKPSFATVAGTGSYIDLKDKPTIPTKTSWNYDDSYVKYSAAQSLTSAQKTQARSNIGAGTSNFSGSYNDLTNKPTIPTVNNATLTIQKNGTTVKTFTANASSNVTANITVPTKTSDLTNDSGFITGVSWSNVTDKPTLLTLDDIGADNIHMNHGDSTSPTIESRISGLSFGKQDKITSTNKLPASNISGLATVATSGSYTDLSNKPTLNNQTIKSGTTTFGANDAVELVAGTNVTVTPDATNKKITISSTNTTYNAATQSAAGLMSAADKTKLDGVATGATKVTTDTVSGWGYTKNAGTVTGVKVGSTSYSPSSGVVSLPAYPTIPTSLKNPNSITIKAGSDIVSSYDGSAAKTFTVAASTTSGAFTISDGTTTKTVQLAGKFTDTTYSSKTAASGGTATSLVTTGEKYTWNNKQDKITSSTNLTVNGLTATTLTLPNYSAAGGNITVTGLRSSSWGDELSETVVPTVQGVTSYVTGKLDSLSYNDLNDKPSLPTVASSIAAGSTSSAVPTSKAVADFVEGKGYKTTDNNTTYTFATGDSNGQIKVTPSGGTAQNIAVKGLGSSAYVTNWTAAECTTFTSDTGSCTPAAVKKAVGLFEPKAHTHSYNDLSNKPTIPTKTSQLTNDSNFISSNEAVTIDTTSGVPLQVRSGASADIAVFGQGGGNDGLYFTTTTIEHMNNGGAVSNTLKFPGSGSYTYTLPSKTGTLATLSDISGGGGGATMYRHMIFCAVGGSYDTLCLVVVNKDPQSLNTNATTKLNISSKDYWRDSYVLGGFYNNTPIIGFIDHPAAGEGFLTVGANGTKAILSCSSWTWVTGGDTVTEI